MRSTFVAISAVLLLLSPGGVVRPQSPETSHPGSVRQKLVGAWRLIWDEEEGADGQMHRALDHTGTIVYTQDGHMSVQIMFPDPGQARRVTNPVRYDQGGYEAYFGTYQVDEQAHTVTHHVEGALVRALIGQDLTRVYRFEQGQLILKSSRPDEHWAIAWEHD